MNLHDTDRDLARTLARVRLSPAPATDARILRHASAALRQTTLHPVPSRSPARDIGGFVMRHPLSSLAALSATIVIVWAALHSTATPAYALEQTVEASRSIRSVHILVTDAPSGPMEMWLAFDEQGRLTGGRNEQQRPPRTLVINGGKLSVYNPETSQFLIVDSAGARAEIDRMLRSLDPRAVAEDLSRSTRDGQRKLIEDRDGDAIHLTLTDPQGNTSSRTVLLIDPGTKLIRERQEYTRRRGALELAERYQYLDYNQPIDPARFALEPPPGAKVDDRTADAGLPQGKMSDAQAAAETLRQYIQALIDEDYDRAARLRATGTPADLRDHRQRVGGEIVRLVKIGTPRPTPHVGDRWFTVPFEYELERDGRRELVGPPAPPGARSGPTEPRSATVRPSSTDPTRWVVDGGI